MWFNVSTFVISIVITLTLKVIEGHQLSRRWKCFCAKQGCAIVQCCSASGVGEHVN